LLADAETEPLYKPHDVGKAVAETVGTIVDAIEMLCDAVQPSEVVTVNE